MATRTSKAPALPLSICALPVTSTAALFRTSTICEAVRLESTDQRSAAEPETIGADIELPVAAE